MPYDSMVITSSTKQLIAATLQGDVSSFSIIVERHWKMAIALALSRINDSTAAEDIAQESLIKAYSQLHKLQNPDCFAGWLARIISQQCVDHIRKSVKGEKAISYEIETFVTLDSGSAFEANPGLTESQRNFVRRSVRRLPDKFKNVVIMRFVGGLTSNEIAQQLGKRNGTIRVWLHRAYTILRKELAPIFEELKKP